MPKTETKTNESNDNVGVLSGDLLAGNRCKRCRWLDKYEGPGGRLMNVCCGDEPEEEDEGLYHVAVVDLDVFDSSKCLMFAEKPVLPIPF